MSPAPIQLLLADVDGTLVTQEKVLTAGAMAAAARLKARGVALAITSGRPPRGMAMLFEPLALETPVAGFNGGTLVSPDLTVLETHRLDPRVARRAVAMILDQGLDVWVYTPDAWIIRNAEGAHVEREAWTVAFAPLIRPFRDADFDQAIKVVGVADDLQKVSDCEKTVQTALADGASVARSQPYYLDVTSALANKGEVVRVLSRRLGIPAQAIATIGDMPNDIVMFEAGGLSIAMGNASADVQSRADVTTESNDSEGFATAVERFVLPLAAGTAAA